MRHNEYKSTLNRLRVRRIERKLEQVQVVKILGLKSTSNLSRWESGTTLPGLVNAFRLAGLYHVMVEDLFHDLFDKIRTEVTKKEVRVVGRDSPTPNDQPSQSST